MGIKMILPEKCQLSVFQRVKQWRTKKQGNDITWDYNQPFTKNFLLSVFELLTYQNAKTYAKHSLWRNRIITLPKTCILSLFDHVTYKRLNTWKKLYVLETKGLYEKSILCVFLSFLSTKKLKSQTTLFIENKLINK